MIADEAIIADALTGFEKVFDSLPFEDQQEPCQAPNSGKSGYRARTPATRTLMQIRACITPKYELRGTASISSFT